MAWTIFDGRIAAIARQFEDFRQADIAYVVVDHSDEAVAISVEVDDDARLARWVRASLVLIAILLATVMTTAAWLHPYDEDGQPRSMATHTQLGLPPCNMVVLTGKPCPSCGMTTAFSLLMHGDVANSFRAN